MTEVKQASKAMLTLMMIIKYTYIFGTGLRAVEELARSWEGEQWRVDEGEHQVGFLGERGDRDGGSTGGKQVVFGTS